MATGVPQTIDDLIYEQINESNKNGTIISELNFQNLIRQAKGSKDPLIEYNCLAALYSHALNKNLTLKNAIKAIHFSRGRYDEMELTNAVAAIANTSSCKELVEISKKNPFILNYEDARNDIYKSSLYALDLDYCDMIVSNYGLPEQIKVSHKEFLSFFDNDHELLAKGGQYINFAIEQLMNVLKINSIRSNSLQLEIAQSDHDSLLGLMVNFQNIDIDKIIDVEEQWHYQLANFSVQDDKLLNISFSMRDML